MDENLQGDDILVSPGIVRHPLIIVLLRLSLAWNGLMLDCHNNRVFGLLSLSLVTQLTAAEGRERALLGYWRQLQVRAR